MKTQHLTSLLTNPSKLFHTNDLAVLWQCSNRKTLHNTIWRYVNGGVLFPIHKGLYSTVPLDQLDPLALGVAYLHRFAYVSTETVLARAGVIAQEMDTITLVADVSLRFVVAGRQYLSRHLRPTSLHCSAGISQQDGYLIASPERATADLLYFNPHYYFDDPNRLNWSQVPRIQAEAGYK